MSGTLAHIQAPGPFQPGGRTLKDFLAGALLPVGEVLYVYGGGWDLDDRGPGPQSTAIGLSPTWRRFFQRQDGYYDYRLWRGRPPHRWNPYYYAGLDCSGYVGWAVYNVLFSRPGGAGFVAPSTRLAQALAQYPGLGGWAVPDGGADSYRPGDIVSVEGHVWIVLGCCADESLVIVHSTPSPSRTGCPGGGVQMSGLGRVPDCQGAALARWYMESHCPAWSARYAAQCKPWSRYTAFPPPHAGRFRWNLGPDGALSDPQGLAGQSAQDVLATLGLHP